MSKKLYFENLDGLRAIAAIAVILTHASHILNDGSSLTKTIVKILSFNGLGGSNGVLFFFILSGFLITYLLINEKEQKGKVNVFFFYIRRILRIWPLYFLTIFVGFFVFPYIYHCINRPYIENASSLYYALFLANFDHILHHGPTNLILGVHWSVCIEEQFYLLWPILFIFKLNLKALVFILCIIFCYSEYYFLNHINDIKGLYHFVSFVRFLSFGAILGYICFYFEPNVRHLLSKLSKFKTFIIYFVSIIILFFYKDLIIVIGPLNYILHFVPFMFFGFVIIEQIYSEKSFFKIGKTEIMTKLGKISYGLYLLHMIVIKTLFLFPVFVHKEMFIVNLIVILSMTIILSHLSYTYFEKRFLRLKNFFN